MVSTVTEESVDGGVIVAEHAGFCTGVKGSLDKLDKIMRESNGCPVYCSHMMVHNEGTMSPFIERGLMTDDGFSKAPKDAVLVVSAHGIGKDRIVDAQNRGFIVLDPQITTCPHVFWVQQRIIELSWQGYQEIIYGDPDHPEIKGLVGQLLSEPAPIVISKAEEANEVPIRKGNVAILCQTTFGKKDFAEVCRILRERKPGIRIEDTICPSVAKRVKAAEELAEGVDVMFVLGSKSSSNTKVLAEAIGNIVHTELVTGSIDLLGDGTRAEFLRSLIKTSLKLGVTAGASTSRVVVDEFVQATKNIRLAA